MPFANRPTSPPPSIPISLTLYKLSPPALEITLLSEIAQLPV